MGKEAKYVVRLTDEERGALESLVAGGRAAADKLLRARMLLKADVGQGGPGWSDEKIAEAFEVGPSTIHRLRQRLVEDGFDAALVRKPKSCRRAPKLDGKKRRGWWRWRAAILPKAARVGRCNCWRTSWWNYRWWTRSATKQSACG